MSKQTRDFQQHCIFGKSIKGLRRKPGMDLAIDSIADPKKNKRTGKSLTPLS